MAKKKETLTVEELVKKAIVPKEEEPYKIPANWVWTRLGEITNIISGGTPKTEVKEYWENGKISWITPKDLTNFQNKYIFTGARNITNLGLQKSSAKLIKKNSVLMSSRAPIGYIAIAGKELCTNQGFKNFEANESFVPEFLYYYLKMSKEKLQSLGSGTTFKEISAEKSRIIRFPLPPLEEQKRIVKKVESLLDKISQVREILKETREKAVLRKESLLNKAFTGELTAKWRESNLVESAQNLLVKINEEKMKKWEDECKKAEEKGIKKPRKPNCKTVAEMIIPKEEEPYKIPANWVWTRLGEVSSYGQVEQVKSQYIDDNSWLLELEDIEKNTSILLNRCLYKDKRSKSNKIKFYTGDVLYSKLRPYLNKIIIADKDGYCTTEIMPINGYGIVKNSIIFYFLKTPFTKIVINNSVHGINLPRLSTEVGQQLLFPLPPLEEQIEIVKILDRVMEQEKEVDRLCDMENTLELLEKSILDRAFRGELGTNIPEEESALEILRKIKER